ncbi:MAG: hypothetical protein M0C28_20420 [Candidatus Moduliflexus flocculans]|nr:hypothetical protein [Candidatus Moduliflexus flocculans]
MRSSFGLPGHYRAAGSGGQPAGLGTGRSCRLQAAVRQRLFHWNWCGHRDTVADGPVVWQTRQAVARVPPWASLNSSIPSPFEVSWQTLQVPIGRTAVWYCAD